MIDPLVTGYAGILFIGDLHLASGRVGRRVDGYSTSILHKLRQAAHISTDRRLFPVILGDVFHRPRENNLGLLSQLIAVLREFPHAPFALAGSHDRTESWFTDKDAVQLLAQVGALRVIESVGPVLTLDCEGTHTTLWATPAGCVVPRQIDRKAGDVNIMITHHDFDFCGKYPGAQELTEIAGCDLLVNGHMHTPTPMMLLGAQACHNPGSVARVSVDLKNHQPLVSAWTPAHGIGLERVPLLCASDVFDLTGKEVYAAHPDELKTSLPKGLRMSSFAAKLRGTDSLEAGRTDDGSVLVEELHHYLTLFDKPAVLKTYMAELLSQVLAAKTAT